MPAWIIPWAVANPGRFNTRSSNKLASRKILEAILRLAALVIGLSSVTLRFHPRLWQFAKHLQDIFFACRANQVSEIFFHDLGKGCLMLGGIALSLFQKGIVDSEI